ncbi:MAG: PDR/VanB family oxidoreductase [Burkholderiaceae bacterium]
MDTLSVIVAEIREAARGILVLRLAPANAVLLPAFEPGAHVDLYLPNGVTRQYSLINESRADGALFYEVAVGLSATSEGGSRYIHDSLRVADALRIGRPRNNFPLVATEQPVWFIAGGIGVTPIRAMLRQCEQEGRDWRLVYAARSHAHAAFADELAAYGERVQFHFDDEHQGKPLDVAAVLGRAPDAAHIYCCGPAPLMTRVRELCAGRKPEQVHFEWFRAPAGADPATGRAFLVTLARQDMSFNVPVDRTILDVLEENGVIVPSVCKDGICGTCECAVLEGDVEHRDQVLTQVERDSGKSLMVCVSRARGASLVLDL